MPMSDFATAQLALVTFVVVAVCGLGVILLTAAVLSALDARSSRKALAVNRQVTPARRPGHK